MSTIPDIPVWNGSCSFANVSSSWYVTGSYPKPTPFGFYDNEPDFKLDADRVADFCTKRLGYPVTEVEIQDINIWAAFEEAITTYGNELYAFRIRDNYLTLEGSSTGSNLNNVLVTPNLSNVIRISEQYGSEAGSGGTITWHSGSVVMTGSIQDYNLNDWAIANGISSSDLEIKRVFYEGPPAITRFFDPYAGTGMGMINLIDSFGWGAYSPQIQFMLMPLSFDVQILQAIELNDQIRKSSYSFQLINNHLRIFPIPGNSEDGVNLWFQYIKKSDRFSGSISNQPGNIINVSNVPYSNPTYTQINSVGRSWIFEYTLVLVKEMLGYNRGKYQNIPVPGEQTSLNQADLISSYKDEKPALIEALRKYLDDTSRRSLLERQSQEREFITKELINIPYPPIFVA